MMKISNGLSNEKYSDDTPYPSRLILGCYKGRLIHVVAANNCLDEEIIVITVYEPDPSEWDPNVCLLKSAPIAQEHRSISLNNCLFSRIRLWPLRPHLSILFVLILLVQ